MDKRDVRRFLPVAIGLVLAFGAIIYIATTAWRPTVTHRRDELLATPSLPGLTTRTDVRVPARGELCVRPVVIPSRMTQIASQVTGVADSDLISVSATSGHARLVALDVTVVGGTSLEATFDPTRTTHVGASVCFKNQQKTPLAFVGTDEARSRVIADTYVNGHRVDADIAVSMLGPATTLGRELPRSSQRAATMGGAAVISWLVPGLLVVLTLGAVGLVSLLAAALVDARRDHRG
jgi:hypothetical protein